MGRFENVAFSAQILNYTFNWNFSHPYSINVVNKGTERNYEKIITTFSSNRFKGQIPEFFGNLKGLRSLNLSNNELDGPIPSSLGNLMELESLDLSQNFLSGKIPQQLTCNTFLSVFNVSHNNLTEFIPQGAQFDTFENISCEGNLGLCGKPLSKPCGSLGPSSPPSSSLQVDKNSESPATIDWVVIILGYGGGLIIGLVLEQDLTTRNHYWFVKTFGRRQ
ncbi:unnamed protein product [Thlaspi arvense]|uniref:Receptor-like protein 12 n=1 Tax=Thlaspi arvense TaxID=13288 RepID=A0AAU9RGW4_THLAR|nr:unnamed protein product [Thlaspi arvense]